MGCDIHLYTEKRLKDGGWYCADHFKINPFYKRDPNRENAYTHISIYDDRDYSVFATLANVRNYDGIIPISEPRGLPNDVSEIVERESDDWGRDVHSHSWLTAKELFIHKNKVPFTKQSGLISPKNQEKLDKYGILPTESCQGTTAEGWERREWICPYSVLERLIEAVKQRMCEEFYIWDFLNPEEKEEKLWEYADDFRIVFWFDN